MDEASIQPIGPRPISQRVKRIGGKTHSDVDAVCLRGESPPCSSAETAILAILDAPLRTDESASAGFARKEIEIRDVMSTLAVLEARSMFLRLASARAGDALVRSFTRMTCERRQRLLAYLGDARRRDALEHAKGGSNG